MFVLTKVTPYRELTFRLSKKYGRDKLYLPNEQFFEKTKPKSAVIRGITSDEARKGKKLLFVRRDRPDFRQPPRWYGLFLHTNPVFKGVERTFHSRAKAQKTAKIGGQNRT